ncbi:putative F-box protein [Tripterygium wilfordii]|uniref:Putative F-box protein n=1 Tax=Tripterygium wilfordii TaxID=458696 RepID=A0A7J7C2Q5_TRIWF|nr:putative F-box protein At5g55150 [Tripterygium wilfordii]KAF5728046.1 putative F-box protein [Tripterygium wilfordii]
MAPSSSWSGLVEELLESIFNRLEDRVDVFRCGLVCAPWRAMALKIYPKFMPLLFYPDKTLEENTKATMLNIATGETLKLDLQETYREMIPCSSSSNGWFLTIGHDYQLNLLNPVSNTRIELPQIPDMQPPIVWGGNYICKTRVSTSSCPLNPGCLVLICYRDGCGLVFCGVGDKEWKALNISTNSLFLKPLDTITWYNGKFYVIDRSRRVWGCNLSSRTLELACELPNSTRYCYPYTFYLAESFFGELLLVLRAGNRHFRVLRLDLGRKEMDEVTRLRKQALFLGSDGSALVHMDNTRSIRGDCIYFMDPGKPHHLLVYDINTNNTIEWLPEIVTGDQHYWTMPYLSTHS